MKITNSKTRREIVYALTSYLYKRLIAYNVKMYQNNIDKPDCLIDLDDYCDAIKTQDEILDLTRSSYLNGRICTLTINYDKELEKRVSSNSEVEKMIKESKARVMNDKDTVANMIYKIRSDIKINYADFIMMSQDNIEEVLLLVQYFVAKYEFEYSYGNEDSFLLVIINKIIRNSKNSKIVALAKKYYIFFSSTKDKVFTTPISGTITINRNHKIIINNHNGAVLFAVDKDNNITKTYNEIEDYILYGKDVVRVFRIDENGNKNYEYGRILEDSKATFFHSILGDNCVYKIKYPRNYRHLSKTDLYFDSYLIDYLKEAGLESEYQNIYDIAKLRDLCNFLEESSPSDREKEVREYALTQETKRMG